MNLYAYCHDNPVNCVDPTGLLGERITDAWNDFYSANAPDVIAFFDLLAPVLSLESTAINTTQEVDMLAADSEGGGVDVNKLSHIFDNDQHNLGNVVSQFGSQEEAFSAIQQATTIAVQQQGLTGIFQTTVQVAGETITVRGAVVNGVVKIGTVYK